MGHGQIREGLYRITKNPADGKYTLTSKDGSKIEFESSGVPLSMTDSNGNRITLVYTGEKLTEYPAFGW